MAETNEILAYFAKQIEIELGIVYSAHNYFQLQNRLDQIARSRNVAGVDELYEEAKRGMSSDFRALLMDIATNNETSFFRDPRIFRAVETSVLSALKPNAGIFRIWSAASSSGQEALSIAMMIAEWNEKHAAKIDFQIFGSDVSGRILKKATDARYTDLEIQRGLSDSLREKYFSKVDENCWLAKDSLRSKMEFKRLNLKEAFHFEKKFDLVFCRNVLIYQAVEAKKQILNRLTEAFLPDGHLVLGAGESLYGLSDAFDLLESEGSVLYRKRKALERSA